MKKYMYITLAIMTLTSCENDFFDTSNDNDNNVLELPEDYFNYEAIAIPDYYFTNSFEGAQDFQQAAMDLDNTPDENSITNAGATLGRVLFYDENLSSNGNVSCASCHSANDGFSDDRQNSRGVNGTTDRHSMSLANARFYSSGKFFWDERAETLEDQVLMPFLDQTEMGLSLQELMNLVENQDYYTALFQDAYGSSEVTEDGIAKAIAQFIRSMVSVTSEYDVARAEVDSPLENFPNFTDQENFGKRLFFEERTLTNGNLVACASCHVSEAFVGSNPLLSSSTTVATNNGINSNNNGDVGVGETTGDDDDNGKFKVPSLKNIAVTAPYMHNGRFDDLEDVIDHYSNGIEDHDSGILVNNNGEVGQFRFTENEKDALIAFLNTLTDNEMLNDEKYSNPFRN